jgi:hypothetical protein
MNNLEEVCEKLLGKKSLEKETVTFSQRAKIKFEEANHVQM